MKHWLEKAEHESNTHVRATLQSPAAQDDERMKSQIQRNYTVNRIEYEDFILILSSLCRRANQLPPEFRNPWSHFDMQTINSVQESHQYLFSSCKRFTKTLPRLLPPFFKLQHVKHVREIVFGVSQDFGKIEIYVREDFFMRRRMRRKGRCNHYIVNPSSCFPFGTSVTCSFNISGLKWELARQVLDWLAFQTELDSIPFYAPPRTADTADHRGWLAALQNWRIPKIQSAEAA